MHSKIIFPRALRCLLAAAFALAGVANFTVLSPPALADLPPAPSHADPSTFHWVATWGAAAVAGELSAPADIALDAAGNVYVADTGNHRVQVFTAAGVFLRTFGRLGRGQGEFYNPRGIAVRGGIVRARRPASPRERELACLASPLANSTTRAASLCAATASTWPTRTTAGCRSSPCRATSCARLAAGPLATLTACPIRSAWMLMPPDASSS